MPTVHLIGIGGAGLSAIATVLLQQGYTVSGSDMQASEATERLAETGATIFIGQQADNLPAAVDTVIVSSAIAPNNPELVAAQQRGLNVVKRAQWLGQMMSGFDGIAIAGTHGKTTTTAMTAYLLQQAGLDPTFIVGGFVPQIDTNAAAGSGKAFVIEADEYDHMFLGLRPKVAVLTIVEWDHPDIFPTKADLDTAFTQFVQLVPTDGLIIGCGDAPGVNNLLKQANAPVVTYGVSGGNIWQATDLKPNQKGGTSFNIFYNGRQVAQAELAVPGTHNVHNALAALIVANHQDVDPQNAASILGQFGGVSRRFEKKGEAGGIQIFDDYAHHPTEIKATLAAARTRFPKHTIWAVFQPHTFSRTLTLLDDFAGAFNEADQVIVVDIFPSREKDEGLVSSRDIVEKMNHPKVYYIGNLSEAADYLTAHLSAPAVLFTLGAGDGYQVGEWVLNKLTGSE